MLKQKRQGPLGHNSKTLGELLQGFWGFWGRQLTEWVHSSSGGRNGSSRSSSSSSVRASSWWGRWVQVPWPPGKPYIFGIEDPFDAGRVEEQSFVV
jgi:hypothetical protein